MIALAAVVATPLAAIAEGETIGGSLEKIDVPPWNPRQQTWVQHGDHWEIHATVDEVVPCDSEVFATLKVGSFLAAEFKAGCLGCTRP